MQELKCDGNILITGGEIAIQSTGGAGKGINCDGSITINDGTVKVITTGTQCVYGKLTRRQRNQSGRCVDNQWRNGACEGYRWGR